MRILRRQGSNHTSSPQDDDVRNTDHFRFGLVFEKPSDVDPSTVSITLLELLQTRSKPSLTQRMILAKAIANCIRYLHSVNWFHKGIRSINIIFFPSNTAEIPYGKPILSGFDYARPASRKELTETPPSNAEFDLYRHPAAQSLSDRQGYRRSFDIYSLGIVLVEIIEWSPVDRIVELKGTETVMTASRVRKRLLNQIFLDSVASNGGTLYERSVRHCLESDEGEGREDEELNAQSGENFYEHVVKRLERIQC
jgi:serine/threonine protein kinase